MATANQPPKVLAVGAAFGSIRDLVTKVQGIHNKHGPFDFALSIGDFFGEDETATNDLLDGKIEVPLPLYIMQGTSAIPSNVTEKARKAHGDIYKNVTLLSKTAFVTTPSGVRLACLGGVYDPEATRQDSNTFRTPHFAANSVDALLSAIEMPSAKVTGLSSLAAIKNAASLSTPYVDILITNVWPSSITNVTSKPPTAVPNAPGAPLLDELSRRVKPKYHFAPAEVFWEREAFAWDDAVGEDRTTRFISLAPFGGPPPAEGEKKQRWFYAFTLSNSSSKAATGKNPFKIVAASAPSKRPRPEVGTESGANYIFGDVGGAPKRARQARDRGLNADGKPLPPEGYVCRRCESTEHYIDDCPERDKVPEGYVCKICGAKDHFIRNCPVKNATGDTGGKKPPDGYTCRACGSELHLIRDCPVAKQQPRATQRKGHGPPKEIGPDECWFCLSNPDLAKYLLVAIGSECYVSLPKGQIVPLNDKRRASKLAPVPGGGHVLIVPIAHLPTFNSAPPEQQISVMEEIQAYKVALKSFYAEYNAIPVSVEIGRLTSKGGHAHVAVVPVPKEFEDGVEAAFNEEAGRLGMEWEEDADAALEAVFAPDRDPSLDSYLRVDLPDGRKLVHVMQGKSKFNLQFGRQVLTDLLGVPDRVNWQDCVQSVEDDTADAQAFKEAFARFAPSF